MFSTLSDTERNNKTKSSQDSSHRTNEQIDNIWNVNKIYEKLKWNVNKIYEKLKLKELNIDIR